MKHSYDWSKLDAGWSYCANQLTGPTLCLNGTSYWTLEFLEREEMSLGSDELAKTQLAKCRIVDNTPLFEAMDRMADECATVTELRPRDEYDWSRLSAGWRVEEDTKVLRHDEDWFRIATLESDVIPDDVYWQRAYVAARAQLTKCRRDWRDEVKQACEGLLGFTVEWYSRSPHATLSWRHTGDSSAITAFGSRTLEVSCNTERIEHVLTMSLIIERLKKLGWREA